MPDIRIEQDGGVLLIIFDRLEKKNALTGAMYLAAAEALREADRDRAIGAVVFAGAGGLFTAGNDIGDFLAASEEPGEFPAFTFIKTLALCQTPLIAAVETLAIGIGATLILHCDLIYAAPRTMFRLPFVDLGVVPEAASSLLLPRRIGMAKASEFLLLGESFDAEEALELRLINAIVPAEELHCVAIEMAKRLATKPREALTATRRLMRGESHEIAARIEEEARLFSIAMRSEKARAIFTAFLGKAQ